MIKITEEYKQMLQKLSKNKPQIVNGYFRYVMNNKEYGIIRIKRSRVNYMLNNNIILNNYDLIHHIDNNKLNDDISNLELINIYNFNTHTSNHHIGKRFIRSVCASNKIKDEVIDVAREILLKMDKKNYSELSRRLIERGFYVSSYTLKRYLG